MAQDTQINFAKRELAAYGITNYKIDTARGKHPQLRWTYEGIEHVVTLAMTSTSNSGALNLRALIRKKLREAGAIRQETVISRSPGRPKTKASGADSLMQRVDQLTAEVDAVVDLLIDSAPQFVKLTEIARDLNAANDYQDVRFTFQANVPPSLVGMLLAMVTSNGVSMNDVRVRRMSNGVAYNGSSVQAPTIHKPIVQVTQQASEMKVIKLPEKVNRYSKFSGSAQERCMIYLYKNGGKTVNELRAAGFVGFGGQSKRLPQFLGNLTTRGFTRITEGGRHTLTQEGIQRLKEAGH